MLTIGCHLSSSKGFLAMGKEAIKIGANTFQYFTRNPRGGAVKALNMGDITAYLSYAQEHEIKKILAHAPYTLNACAKEENLRNFAKDVMTDDLSRLAHIPGSMYNFHPGSHVKQGEEIGIQYIASLLNEVIHPKQDIWILLETMAGKGTEIGRTFEEIRAIIDKVEINSKLGVCLDTCHVFDGGYDIVNNLENVIREFDQIIGLNRLKAIHLNGSMNTLGSHKDRHEKIGQGEITLTAIQSIINHPAFRELPFYLETPNDLDGYEKEIEILKELYQE